MLTPLALRPKGLGAPLGCCHVASGGSCLKRWPGAQPGAGNRHSLVRKGFRDPSFRPPSLMRGHVWIPEGLCVPQGETAPRC